MIVYKIKDNQIVGISTKDDNYQLKENEYGSAVWYQKPLFTGSEIVETITQDEIDAAAIIKEKEDKIAVFYNSHSTVWVGKTPDGTKDYAVVIGNDGKLSTIEIK